jgi:cytochrome c
MKKIILTLAVATVMVGCGNSGGKTEQTEEKKETEKTTEPVSELSDNPVYQKGLALIAKSDCLTCHKVDEPLTGPTYRDVANKYGSMPDTIVKHLAGKIISGGNGVWGEVFMTPHPGVSQEDAEAMVKYILLLKK